MQPLRSRTAIQRAFQEGVRVYSPWAVLHARRRGAEEDLSGIRLGIIASKRVGQAVARNRARRVLRETARLLLAPCAAPWDVLFVARPEVLRTEFAVRRRGLEEMFRKAGILEEASCTP